MLTDYIQAAMRHAEYEQLGDGAYFGRIPGFHGVWASTKSRESCRRELQEVLEDWLLLGLKLGHPMPIVDGLALDVAVA